MRSPYLKSCLQLVMLFMRTFVILNTPAVVEAQCEGTNITLVEPLVASIGTKVTIHGCGLTSDALPLTNVAVGAYDSSKFDPNDGGVDSIDFVNETYLVVTTIHYVSRRCGTVRLYDNASNVIDGIDIPDVEYPGDGASKDLPKICYAVSPMILGSVDPLSGAEGTLVTLEGLFAPTGGTSGPSGIDTSGIITSVKLGEFEATIVSQSDEKIVVKAGPPTFSNETGAVTVTANTGTYCTKSGAGGKFTYKLPGEITSVNPTLAQYGTRVTITGTDLFGVADGDEVADVRFGSVEAVANDGEIEFQNNTYVIVRVGRSASLGTNLRVTSIANDGAEASLDGDFVHAPDAVITSITPPAAATGAEVTIGGERLLCNTTGIESLTIAGSAVDISNGILKHTDTELIFETPEATGQGEIKLIMKNGAIAETTSSDSLFFRYANISGVTPTFGQQGTRVTITGIALDSSSGGIKETSLVNTAASVEVNPDPDFTSFVIVAGEHASSGTGSVTITSKDDAELTSIIEFTYLEPPVITDISPGSGQQGTTVTISGSGMRGGGINFISVLFNGIDAATVHDRSNDTEIIAIIAPGDPGKGDVLMTTETGSYVKLVNGFTYTPLANITKIEPSFGQAGTIVTITGVELFGGGNAAASVTLADGVEAEIVTQSDTEIIVIAGSSDETIDNVTVIADSGAYISTSDPKYSADRKNGLSFEYLEVMTIDSILPENGTYGTLVTISGSGLLCGGSELLDVELSEVAVSEILSVSETVVVVRAGNKQTNDTKPGVSKVTAKTGAFVTLPDSWKYFIGPVITSVKPSLGAGNTIVTIEGTNLLAYGGQIENATLNGVWISKIISAFNDTYGVVQAGYHDTEGVGNVVLISDAGGLALGSDMWTYVPVPEVSDVAPAVGISGSEVVISGQSFFGGGSKVEQVTLVGVEAEIVTGLNTLIIIHAGDNPDPSSATSGDITITSDNGALLTAAGAWSYQIDGKINFITPKFGQAGSSVTIRGIELQGNEEAISAAKLNGVLAEIIFQNDTYVILKAGAGDPGKGDVELVIDASASITVKNGFTYLEEGFISSVDPKFGIEGTRVTIAGERLLGNGTSLTGVTLANIAAKSIEFVSDEKVIVVANKADTTAGPGDVVITSNSGAVIDAHAEFAYVEPPEILSVTPDNAFFGHRITIAGTGLLGGATAVTNLTIAGVDVYEIESANNSFIIARVGDNAGEATSPGDIKVVYSTSAFFVNGSRFSYVTSGNISSVTPSSGQGGVKVYLNGTNLLGGGTNAISVVMAGISATVITASDTSICVFAGENYDKTPEGIILVISDNGAISSTITNADSPTPTKWTYIASGNITSVTPSRGIGGTIVTIEGIELLGGGVSLANLMIGGKMPDSIKSANKSMIIAVAAANSPGTGEIVITSDTGTIVRSSGSYDKFEYLVVPAITSVSPAIGQVNTVVTVTGSDLLGGGSEIESATLGGVTASVNAGSNNSVVVLVAGASTASTGSVKLVADSGATIKVEELDDNPAWTYGEAGNITNVSPDSGQSGTIITISGNHLRGHAKNVSKVAIGGVEANILRDTDTEVIVTAGLGIDDSSTTLDIVVTADSGATTTGAGVFTYVSSVNITSINPATGQAGALVTIDGFGLLAGGNSVISAVMGDASTDIIFSNNTLIVLRVGASETDGVANLTFTSDNGATSLYVDAFTFVSDPDIVSIDPAAGQEGTIVTIRGTTLLGGGTEITSVKLNGTEVESIDFNNNTMIVVTVAAASAGTGSIIITADSGATYRSISSIKFEYEGPSAITSVKPTSGQVGTFVTITGTDLLGVSEGTSLLSATIRGTAAKIIEGYNSTYVILQCKSNSPGNGDIVLTANSGARTTKKDAFTYLVEGQITEISPKTGQLGTLVTIAGNNLLGGGSQVKTLTLGGITVVSVTFANSTIVVARANNASTDTVGVAVITAETGAFVTTADFGTNFTYAEASKITSISPEKGQKGTRVTIVGSGFIGAGSTVDTVTLAGISSIITFKNDTYIELSAGGVPGGDSLAAGQVIVTNDIGAQAIYPRGWAYVPEAKINQVFPNEGQVGTHVILNGTSMLALGSSIVTATLGGNSATVEFANDTRVELTAGPGPDSDTIGDVILTSDSGGVSVLENGFKYLEPGAVIAVSPNQGQGQAEVAIAGSSLCGAGATKIITVTLASIEATITSQTACALVEVVAGKYTFNNVTQGDVVIVGDTGAVVTEKNGWSYLAPGEITSVIPEAGQGGDKVTIIGTDLYGGASSADSVTFNGVPAIINNGFNSTHIVLTVGNGPISFDSPTGDIIITGSSAVKITSKNAWTYSFIESIKESYGQGGTRVVMKGIRLLGGGTNVTKVTLADVEVDSVLSANESYVEVVAGAFSTSSDSTGDVEIVSDSKQTVTSVAGTSSELSFQFTYKVAGSIDSVTPAKGQGGSTVVIRGSTLFGSGDDLTTVTLTGVEASIILKNNTYVQVIAGPSTSAISSGNVILVADTGAIVTAEDAFEYADVGNITDVSPTKGQLDTVVVITGTGLLSGASSLGTVSLSGTDVKRIVLENETYVKVIADTGSKGIGDVVITSADGAIITKKDAFSYLDPPAIASVAPNNGQIGTMVVLVGTQMRAGADKVSKATLNGETAEIKLENDTYVSIVAAAGAAGTGDVVLTASSGATVTAVDAWTYVTQSNITSVDPASGQDATVVTISGTGLRGGGAEVTAASMAGTAATIKSETDTKVVVTISSATATTGDVILTADTGALSTLKDGFTQLADGTIASVDPVTGQEGTVVVIKGSRLLGGGSDLASVSVAGKTAKYTAGTGSDTEVTVVVASGGTADKFDDVVLIADTGAVITAVKAFAYTTQSNIFQATPAVGQQGTAVAINGTDLLGNGTKIVSVTLNGVEVQMIVDFDDTMVNVVANLTASAGTGDVVLTADTGAITTETDGWTYVDEPIITKIEPVSGQAGTKVTITGISMYGGGTAANSVTLAGIEVEKIESQSASSIVVTVGNSSAATGDVVVTTETGSYVALYGGWEYLANGVVTSVTPSKGGLGSTVYISGERLLGGGNSVGVSLAGEVVSSVVSANNSMIVVIAARSAVAGDGDIIIVANTGATVTLTDGFEYVVPGNITAISPTSGQEKTRVTISGTNLLGGASSAATIKLAGIVATIINSSAKEVIVELNAVSSDVSGDVKIVGSTGVFCVDTLGGFSHFRNGLIDEVSPSSGVGGTVVFIYGQDLQGQGSKIESATFGGVEVAEITKQSNFYLQVIVGESIAATELDIVLTADTGAVITKSKSWTYAEAGNITNVDPIEGSVGTLITIIGHNMRQGSSSIKSVVLGGVIATIVQANDTYIVIKAGSTDVIDDRLVEVRITSADDSVLNKSAAFTYTTDPDIHVIFPTYGQGGTVVTIEGVELLSGASALSSVTLGGITARKIVSANESVVILIAEASATAISNGDVVVVSDKGSKIIRSRGWDYVTPGNITSIYPTVGQIGTKVSVTGTGLLNGGSRITSATLAGSIVTEVLFSNETFVVLETGANTSSTKGPIVLTSDSGAIATGAEGITFTYIIDGQITTVDPSEGIEGTLVTITGTNLRGGGDEVLSVTFNGVNAVVKQENDTYVIAELQAAASGKGHVVVHSNTGSKVTALGAFTYLDDPEIALVSPARGQLGTWVTIYGVDMLGGGEKLASITLGGVKPFTMGLSNSTYIQLRAGESQNLGVGDIIITADSGAVLTAKNSWTYDVGSNITAACA